jgi:hypothetical protein
MPWNCWNKYRANPRDPHSSWTFYQIQKYIDLSDNKEIFTEFEIYTMYTNGQPIFLCPESYLVRLPAALQSKGHRPTTTPCFAPRIHSNLDWWGKSGLAMLGWTANAMLCTLCIAWRQINRKGGSVSCVFRHNLLTEKKRLRGAPLATEYPKWQYLILLC